MTPRVLPSSCFQKQLCSQGDPDTGTGLNRARFTEVVVNASANKLHHVLCPLSTTAEYEGGVRASCRTAKIVPPFQVRKERQVLMFSATWPQEPWGIHADLFWLTLTATELVSRVSGVLFFLFCFAVAFYSPGTRKAGADNSLVRKRLLRGALYSLANCLHPCWRGSARSRTRAPLPA